MCIRDRDYIIEGGQTMNPSTEDIMKAVDKVNADTIFVLPNNSNIILAAEQAKSLVEDKKLIVIQMCIRDSLCTVLAAILTYLITGRVYYLDTTFVNASLFLAFAFEYPDMEVLLMFIIPIKMKWMAYLSMVVYAVDFIQGNMGTRIAILVSLLNFVLYFSSIIKRKGYSPKQMRCV